MILVEVVRIKNSLDSATKQFVNEDMCQPFQMGRPMVNMAILHQEGTKTDVLVRMSHAIYDVLSFPIILDTLRTLYARQSNLETPLSSFSAYVHDLISHTSRQSYCY
jgi:hypothetical protein